MKSKTLPFLLGLSLAPSLHAQIKYVDATAANTTGSAFVTTANVYNDNQWSIRTVGANNSDVVGNTVLEAGPEGGTENVPVIATQITGLTPGATYEIFVYFVTFPTTDANQLWRIRAGFDSGALTAFDRASAGTTVLPDASTTTLVDPSNAPVTVPTNRDYRQASLGTAVADSSGHITVFVDSGIGTLDSNHRTWYDGVGYQIADTDGDGMPNSWEIANGTDPNVNDANEDPDFDNLSNIKEYQNNGLPLNPDTDNDGLDDGPEFVRGTLLNNPDSDGDFYLDGVEVNRSTDPLDFNSFPAPIGGMKVDFSAENSNGQTGVYHHSDWFTYVAPHEVTGFTDRTETWNVPAFAGASVSLTVAYPDSTANTVRQMIGRTDAQAAAYTGESPRLMRDWVGIDTRTGSAGNGTATDTTMTFTIAGLPAGTYRYRGYHHDVEFQGGRFGIKVTDATRSASDLGFFRMTHSGQNTYQLSSNPGGDPANLSSTIDLIFVSNGVAPVVLTYTGRETASAYTSFVAVNGFEIVTDMDSDGDFVPNSADLHPGVNDATLDDDGDGLSNLREYHLGTNPSLADTDGDGLKDGVETNTETYIGLADSGTSPFLADTDGDGANDGAEANGGSNPFDPTSLPPSGPFKVLSATLNTTTNEYTLQWESTAGATYDVVYSDTLTGAVATWAIAADDVASQGTTTTRVVALGSPRPARRFFVVIRN